MKPNRAQIVATGPAIAGFVANMVDLSPNRLATVLGDDSLNVISACNTLKMEFDPNLISAGMMPEKRSGSWDVSANLTPHQQRMHAKNRKRNKIAKASRKRNRR